MSWLIASSHHAAPLPAAGVKTSWDDEYPKPLVGRQFECGKCGKWAHSECYARYKGLAELPEVMACHRCCGKPTVPFKKDKTMRG